MFLIVFGTDFVHPGSHGLSVKLETWILSGSGLLNGAFERIHPMALGQNRFGISVGVGEFTTHFSLFSG